MKNKFLFMCLGALLSLNLFSQSSTLIHQDFEGALTGWTATTAIPTWGVNDYITFNSANFTIPAPPVSSETSVAAVSNTGGQGKMLISPAFNAVGYDSVEIWFDYYFQNGSNNYFEFGYSNDGGTSITDAYDLTGPTTSTWQRVYLTVYPADLTPTMLFYFYFEGMTVGGLAIDNVTVIGYNSIPNQTCANATVLTPNTTCVPTAATIELNTNSGGASSCYPTRSINSDSWFQFTATSTIHKVSAAGVDLRDVDLVMEVYSGSCGSLSLLECVDRDDVNDPSGTGIEEYYYGNFVIGQTYYVRLYNYFLSNYPAAVNICVESFASCNLTQPTGSTVEIETCGVDMNGGCNMLPATPSYQDISCGETIWGTIDADNGNRDTDWYRFTISNPSTVTWTVESEVPAILHFIDITNCSNPISLASTSVPSCSSTVLTYNFTSAGTYVAFVSPDDFYGFPCSGVNTNYIATLNYTLSAPTITAGGSTTFCNGGSVVLTATGTGTYQWYNGATAITGANSSTYTATTAGSYTVIATNGACVSTASNAIVVTLTTPPAPTVSAGGATTFCQGGSVVLTATGSGSFQWYEGTTAIPGANSSTLTVSAAGSYSVEEISGGCTSARSTSTTVTVTPLDNATFTYANTTVCAGSANVTPTVTTAGGTFSSTSGLVFADPSTGEIDVAGSTNGTYTITYTTAGTCPNTSTVSFTVTNAPDATFSYPNSSYCTNGTDPMPVFTTGSAGSFTSSGGLIINPSSGEITLATSIPGQYTVTNTIAASGSCPATSATATVEVLEVPTATISGSGSLCGGTAPSASVALTGSGPWDITINDGTTTNTVAGITTSPYTFVPSVIGTYTITNVTDGTCSSTGTGSVVITAGTGYTSTNNQTICPGGSYTINGNTYTLAGSYNDTFTAQDGCDSTVTTNLSITNINVGVTKNGFSLTSDMAGASYQWVDCASNTDIAGATSQTFNPTVDGDYKVKVTVAGCTEESACTEVKGISINEAFMTNVNVFPNPSSDYVVVNAGSFTIDRISLVNIEGKILSSTNVNAVNATINLSNVSDGLYFLYIYSADNMVIKKLIKK